MSSPHSACLNFDGLTGWALTKLNRDDVSRAPAFWSRQWTSHKGVLQHRPRFS